MAVEEYFDNLFKTACGWLGWEPETVLTTTIGQIELAIEGKIDFVKKTNPWGNEENEEEEFINKQGDPEIAAKQLVEIFKQRQVQNSKFAKKPKPKVKRI